MSESDQEEVVAIMSDLDAQAGSQDAAQIDKRAHVRKPVRINCEIRLIGCDTETVLWLPAVSRELSAGGMSFVSRQHFRRQASILVTLYLAEGANRRLSAVVAHSRGVREGWFLTGVSFRKSDDTRLQPGSYDLVKAEPAFPEDSEEDENGLPARERLLRMLERVRGRRTKGNLLNVVSASMNPDPLVRRACVPVLMDLAGQEANRALIRLLNDVNPQIQGEAAEALGTMGTKQAIESIKALLQHSEDEVCIRAAEALGKLGDKSGRRVAARLVRSENPIAVRAAKALGLIVGRPFRPTVSGLQEARDYLDAEGD